MNHERDYREAAAVLMGREARRVPLDFDWPLGQVWGGYIRPDNLRLDQCPGCGGDGYSPEARAIADTFYPHMIGHTEKAQALAWHDKIGQQEVDHLVRKGRLSTWVPGVDGERGQWESLPRIAEEVNAEQRTGGMNGHDAINRGLLVEYRCKRLGIAHLCTTCNGDGEVEKYPGQRADSDAWEWTEPPTGEGWQMWETTSEGSPSTPVFTTPGALAVYCAIHCTTFGRTKATANEWLRIIVGEDFAHVVIAPGVIVM